MTLRGRFPFLLHLSPASHIVGAQIGPLPPRARMAGLSPVQKATEVALEAAKPASQPSRLNAVFATAHMDFVHTFLRKEPGRRVYLVEIASGANACGPLDMRYVDWLTANGPTPPHPAE